MEEQEKVAVQKIVAQVAAETCPTQKRLKDLKESITHPPHPQKSWAEITNGLDPRRTAVFVTDKYRPHIPWYKRRSCAERIVANAMFLMEYGYHTVFVETKSEYGLLTFAILSKMRQSGLALTLQEFGLATVKSQWKPTFPGSLAFELSLGEYDDFMQKSVSLAVYPNGFAFNKEILPGSLIEMMRGNMTADPQEDQR